LPHAALPHSLARLAAVAIDFDPAVAIDFDAAPPQDLVAPPRPASALELNDVATARQKTCSLKKAQARPGQWRWRPWTGSPVFRPEEENAPTLRDVSDKVTRSPRATQQLNRFGWPPPVCFHHHRRSLCLPGSALRTRAVAHG